MSKKEAFCCPHCGESKFYLSGSISKVVEIAPPQNGRVAAVIKDYPESIEYDYFTCRECDEELEMSNEMLKLLYDSEKKHTNVINLKFAPPIEFSDT